jgi:hypothetical protein
MNSTQNRHRKNDDEAKGKPKKKTKNATETAEMGVRNKWQ